MYYFGDRSGSLMHYCQSSDAKDGCYESVFYKAIQSSYATLAERTDACTKLPEKIYAQECTTRMKNATY
jgi:hypothetical protein